MSITISNKPYRGGGHDHFEPEAFLDPVVQRKLRGHLEQFEYVLKPSSNTWIRCTASRFSML